MTHSLSLIILLMEAISTYGRPQYEALPCGRPTFEEADVVHSFLVAKSGDIIELECKHKFYSASPKSTCLNGQWTEPTPRCRYVECPEFGYLKNGNHNFKNRHRGVGEKVTFSCNEGYWLDGTETRVCQRDGQWSGREVQCKEVRCPEPQLPPGGNLMKKPPYRFNEEVDIFCNKGYVYTGQPIKCQHDNTWSVGHIGNCTEISKIRCSFTRHFDHMKVYTGFDTYKYNQSITIDCDEGFFYSGTRKKTCAANSTWTGAKGTCIRIYCGKPTFGIINGQYEACDPCPYSTELNVVCHKGYTLKKQASPICKNAGQLGTWLNMDVKCKGIDCGSVPDIENGKIEDNTGGSFMDKRAVQCDQGYQYKGPGNITCQHDGQWSFPGVCSKGKDVATPIVITFGAILLMIIILVGIVFRLKRNNGAKRLKVSIQKAGHVVENVLDPKIDLDREFVPLKLITSSNRATQKMAKKNVSMDKYLSYVERYEHKEVSPDDLIDGMEGGGLMILCGRAGVGKTTLVQKLTRRWAQKEWAQNYGAVFVYNMRYISPKDNRPMTLAEFLEGYMVYKPAKFYPTISKGITVHGEGWIIFLDAIDEFPYLMTHLEKDERLDCLQKNLTLPARNWCIHLMRMSILQKAVLVLTSRHIKGLKKLEPIKSIELVGLTPKAIDKMIEYQIKETAQANQLKELYQNNPIILSVSSITFFCIMVCKSFNENQQVMTEGLRTYTRITAFLIQVYIKRNVYEKEENEEAPLNQSEMMTLLPLAKLAYMGLIANQNDPNHAQLAFDDDDLKKAGVSENDVSVAQELGLLVCSEIQLPGKEDKYIITEFVHLSMQELLAMVYLINDSNEHSSAVEIFNKMWNTKKFYMAQLYLFGLCFDEEISGVEPLLPNHQHPYAEKLKHDLRHALVECAGQERGDRHQVLRAIQATYESQNTEVSREVAKALFVDGKIMLRDMPLTAVDLLGIIFSVESHEQISEMWLEWIKTDESSLKIFSTFLLENKTLKTLSLRGIVQTKTTFESLMDAVSKNMSLRCLYLEFAEIDDEMIGEFDDVLEKNKFLEEISFAHNRITDVGISKVAEGLRSNESLKKLILDTERMDTKYIGQLAYLTTGNSKVEIVLHGPRLSKELQTYVKDSKSLQKRISHTNS